MKEDIHYLQLNMKILVMGEITYVLRGGSGISDYIWKVKEVSNIQFKFYVLNYNFNKRKVEMFNIFNNIRVQEYTEKTVRKYLRSPKNFTYTSYFDKEEVRGFDAFVKELDSIIAWQERGRCEYEMCVGYTFEDDCNKLEKWDCYQQCTPNMEMIAREVIFQYKQYKKKECE